MKHCYEIGYFSHSDGCIHINDTIDDSFDEPDSFVYMTKCFKKKFNGVISECGDDRYVISNCPYKIVFQWDVFFGIVIESKVKKKTVCDEIVDYIKKILIEINDESVKP